jgi:hypothetical protein
LAYGFPDRTELEIECQDNAGDVDFPQGQFRVEREVGKSLPSWSGGE